MKNSIEFFLTLHLGIARKSSQLCTNIRTQLLTSHLAALIFIFLLTLISDYKGDWTQIGTPGISLVYYNYCTKYSGLPPGISLENRIKILEVDNVLIY